MDDRTFERLFWANVPYAQLIIDGIADNEDSSLKVEIRARGQYLTNNPPQTEGWIALDDDDELMGVPIEPIRSAADQLGGSVEHVDVIAWSKRTSLDSGPAAIELRYIYVLDIEDASWLERVLKYAPEDLFNKIVQELRRWRDLEDSHFEAGMVRRVFEVFPIVRVSRTRWQLLHFKADGDQYVVDRPATQG